ncbi:MAG: hypothetical protein ACK5KN_07545 [Dysgonomonas sp.]|uniref:hypothetical protein n=1 Tax=Dysgonomonas sp. TaxID=1891233 RepID=UPI003A893263
MKGKKWTAEQEELLIQYYRRKEVAELANLIGKSEQAVMNRASNLGLKRKGAINLHKEQREGRKQEQEAKQILLTDVENEIEKCEDMLLQLCKPGNIGLWSSFVAKYHALWIKRCQMRGERPSVMHIRTDYII